MVGLKADIGGKKRGPRKGSKDKPRVAGKKGAAKGFSPAGGLMAMNMRKGRASEKSPKAALGTQKIF